MSGAGQMGGGTGKCSRQREWLLQRPGMGTIGVILILFDGGDN